jgi:hypothetical protein
VKDRLVVASVRFADSALDAIAAKDSNLVSLDLSQSWGEVEESKHKISEEASSG